MTDILDHIEAHSPRGAENVRRRLQAVVEMSLTIPRSGRATNKGGRRRVVVHLYPM